MAHVCMIVFSKYQTSTEYRCNIARFKLLYDFLFQRARILFAAAEILQHQDAFVGFLHFDIEPNS